LLPLDYTDRRDAGRFVRGEEALEEKEEEMPGVK
jgi:hypothetical protein